MDDVVDDPRFPEHRCRRFKEQPCVFCRMNFDARRNGFEVVPFDVPGEYTRDEKTIPHIKARSCPKPGEA